MLRRSRIRATSALCSAWAALTFIAVDTASARADDSVLVRVSPTGGDDTALLQAALKRCEGTSTPCTVGLGAGHFHTRQLVAKNFRGSLVGQGPGRTTIHPAGTLQTCPVLCPFNPDADKPDLDHLWPDLMIFIDGSFRLADFSVTIDPKGPDGQPAPATTPYLLGTALISAIRVIGHDANVVHAAMDNVSISGSPDPHSDWFGINLINCTIFAGELLKEEPTDWNTYTKQYGAFPLRGIFKFTRNVAHTCISGFDLNHLFDSRVTVGGESAGNSTSDVRFGVELGTFENTTAEISNNTLAAHNWANIVIYNPDYPTTAPSRYAIHDNLVLSEGGGPDGILPWDNDGEPKVIQAAIVHNTFRGGDFYGMIHPTLTTHTLIAGNDLRGPAFWGIALESVSESSVLFNSIGGVQAEIARIWLDKNTRGSLVAGRCAPGDVVDEGTGNRILCAKR